MKNRSINGFTLVELMIVMSIITILTTMVTVGLLSAKGKAKIQVTQAMIAKIQSGLESYNAAYGDYPPTNLADMYIGAANGINNGIESVFYCLSNQNKGGPFLSGIMDSDLGNLDQDSFGTTQLREINDSWKFPIVYFHSRDYDTPAQGSNYSNFTGDSIAPQFNPATPGAYYNPYTFQLWSVGPDLKNKNGSGDDVNNWK